MKKWQALNIIKYRKKKPGRREFKSYKHRQSKRITLWIKIGRESSEGKKPANFLIF